jgi:hypothetical protein
VKVGFGERSSVKVVGEGVGSAADVNGRGGKKVNLVTSFRAFYISRQQPTTRDNGTVNFGARSLLCCPQMGTSGVWHGKSEFQLQCGQNLKHCLWIVDKYIQYSTER